MTMKYRRLSPTGDYTFGQNNQDFLYDGEAVGQACKTRCQLYLGTFWRAINAGIPMFQNILASPGSAANLTAVDGIFRTTIEQTKDVTEMVEYQSSYNRDIRRYEFSCKVNTLYTAEPLQVQGQIL